MDSDNLKNLMQFVGRENVWIAEVFVVVFGALLLDFLQKRALRKAQKSLEHTKNLWDDALIHAIQRPLSVLIWVLGLTFAAQIVGKQTDASIFQVTNEVRDLGVIATIAWSLVRFVNFVEQKMLASSEAAGKAIDRTTVDAIAKLLRISILITSALVALQTLGFSVSGVLAFGGIGGIAIGFAAKDLLANFFGGLMIYLDRPFEVGDWIRSPDREIEGTVEKIGWRLTEIRTFDKRPLYVPNSTFTSIAVQNPSRMSNGRIYETIGVRYDDVAALPVIVRDVEMMLREHPEIDTDQTLMVNFNTFGHSSLDFFVYTFTRTTAWVKFHEIKQDILFRISDIIMRHGAEIAFPTSTIHLADGGGGERRQPVAAEGPAPQVTSK
ncbi:MAG: mechanosensitive ion channel family protein [Pseudomonadota bacterium]|nr:MAG: mechanosensitive ion channel family protein [Pseudomonadota bacterium]